MPTKPNGEIDVLHRSPLFFYIRLLLTKTDFYDKLTTNQDLEHKLQKILIILLVLLIPVTVEAKQYKLLIIGDSITHTKFSYGYLFQKIYPTRVIAKSGASVRWMYQQIENLSLEGYTHLLILGGVNDINNYRLRYTKKYLLKIYRKAKQSGLTIIGITLSPWKGWPSWNIQKHKLTLSLNRWIKNQSIDYVADLYELVKNPQDNQELAPKYKKWTHGLHFNKLAHKALFRYIAQIL